MTDCCVVGDRIMERIRLRYLDFSTILNNIFSNIDHWFTFYIPGRISTKETVALNAGRKNKNTPYEILQSTLPESCLSIIQKPVFFKQDPTT